jgi:CMP-N-acetylneuraminic acid synthetase
MLPIGGRPVAEHVIAWSQSLRELGVKVTTVVSTNIPELEEICERHRAIYLFRSEELAADTTRIEDVILDAYERVQNNCDYISLLYGNIPTRHSELFLGPIAHLEKNLDVDAVLTFHPVEKFHPAWMAELRNDRLPSMPGGGYRRQDLKPYMIHDGHTIISRRSYFCDHWPPRNLQEGGEIYAAFGSVIKPWLHDRLIVDIDTERDYLLAKAVMESGNVL